MGGGGVMRTWLRRLWRWVREASGDAAYELYLERVRPERPLSRKEFWLEALHRRYSGPSRCC
ncbi:MAG: DUF466 domain-containing protein [Acidobacteria bacterium]|nr:MAG: DUF466 domain-containing protein [Acidobacteriota bacterium]